MSLLERIIGKQAKEVARVQLPISAEENAVLWVLDQRYISGFVELYLDTSPIINRDEKAPQFAPRDLDNLSAEMRQKGYIQPWREDRNRETWVTHMLSPFGKEIVKALKKSQIKVGEEGEVLVTVRRDE